MADRDANIVLANRMYEYTSGGNWPELEEILTDDFEIVEADGLPFGGTCRGKSALRQTLDTVLPILRPSDIRVKSLTANDSEVVALLDLVFEGQGESFVMPVAEYFEMREGLICRIMPYFFDTAGMAAFLARRGPS